VGAKIGSNELGEVTGAVYLYTLNALMNANASSSEREGVTPEPFKILYGQFSGDMFGNAVALSRDGRHLIVGSRSENEGTGAIRIYQISENDVTLEAVFAGQNLSGRAGWTVAISGDGNIVAMGATKGGSNGGGLITTYQYQAPDWVLYGSAVEAKYSEDVAGYSLALSNDGTIMAVGSVKHYSSSLRNAGKATVYNMNGSDWEVRDEIFGESRGILEGSSISLSQDGKVLVVGGGGFSNSNQAAGRCQVFEWKDTDYELVHTMLGQADREALGTSAAVSDDGSIIACGGASGRWSRDTSSKSGVVRLWNRLTLREKAIWPKGDSRSVVDDASFGTAVSLSADGKRLLVGASTWSGTNSDNPGGVQIFDTFW